MAIRPNITKKVARFNDLLKAVDEDNPTNDEIAALRKALRETPELWRAVGDMAYNAASHLIDEIQGPKSLKMSMEQGWKSLQKELGVAESTPLERLLIQQVALSWMRLSLVEYVYTSITTEGATFEKLNYWEKRLNASQRRFLRACETLARIRKMDLPPIQVNIAEQQVNVSG